MSPFASVMLTVFCMVGVSSIIADFASGQGPLSKILASHLERKRLTIGQKTHKQELAERELQLKERKLALEEEKEKNRGREIALREQRLAILNDAVSGGASTGIIAALGNEELFELGEVEGVDVSG